MKNTNVFRAIQRRENNLDKERDSLQRQLEKEHEDSAIKQILARIDSNNRERYLLYKISEGAIS